MAKPPANSALLSPLTGLLALRRRKARVSPFAIAAFLIASLAFGGLSAIAMFGDPLGGEPRVAVAVDPSLARLRPSILAEAPPEAPVEQPQTFGEIERPAQTMIAPEAAGIRPAPKPEPPAKPRSLGPPPPLADLLANASDGQGGPMPKIGPDGARASDYYVRPFDDGDGRPRIGIILSGLGLSQSMTAAAIKDLPPEVTLSFVPYAKNLSVWTAEARAAGHELMLEIPMEPFDYPANDPGPLTLLTSNSRAENDRRLDWLMGRFQGYFAVMNYQGAKFSTSHTSLKPFLQTLSNRGVAYIDNGGSQRSVLAEVTRNTETRWTVVDRFLNARATPESVDRRLLELEALALQNGASLGQGLANPVTVKHIKNWVADLEARGYVIAPASSVLRLRTRQAQQG
ncbi:MAG: divergent polysaccharide deacetylase family protein [Pseudomonadota bacterium]